MCSKGAVTSLSMCSASTRSITHSSTHCRLTTSCHRALLQPAVHSRSSHSHVPLRPALHSRLPSHLEPRPLPPFTSVPLLLLLLLLHPAPLRSTRLLSPADRLSIRRTPIPTPCIQHGGPARRTGWRRRGGRRRGGPSTRGGIGRQAERQRENNGRVRGVMQHTCPPPVPQAREGVAERKEDRQRQLKRAEMERTSDGLLLHSAGDELNILAAVPSSSSHSAVAASIASTDLRNSRREPVAAQRPSHPSIRPAAQAQSRIKPLLDRDRRQSTLYDKWGATVSMQPTVSSEEGSRDMRFVPPASSPLSSSSYASLIRSLAADPIVSSFASQPGQQQPPQQQPEPLSALSRPSSDSSSLSMSSALSRRAELLAAAASVSTAAAAAALDGLDNVNRDTDEDRLAARRKWDSIAAEQAAKPFNRQLQRHGQSTGWREVQVEDGSDDSDEAERMLGERTSSSRASRS